MDFSTERFKESVEQIATVMSDLVTAYVQEDGGMVSMKLNRGWDEFYKKQGDRHWVRSWKRATRLAKVLLLLDISDHSSRQATQWVGQKQQASEQKWENLRD